MNKQKWTEKPVTWGGYLKLSGINDCTRKPDISGEENDDEK